MTARSLSPLPAALAAKLAPSPVVAAPTRPTGARQRSRPAPRAAGASAGAGGARGASALIAVRTISALNAREHYRARAERVRRERLATLAALRAQVGTPPPLPPRGSGRKLLVVLTRIAPRALDSDNCAGALKSVRDAVAQWLSIDDADPRVHFEPEQDPGDRHAVRVEFVRDAVPCDCRHGWRAK